jgi:hypothetical protein
MKTVMKRHTMKVCPAKSKAATAKATGANVSAAKASAKASAAKVKAKVIKKPAARVDNDVPGVLTKAALEQLAGANDDKINSFVEGLNDLEQQRLWKKFQSSREFEGTDGQYKDLVRGTGSRDMARSLLKVYIQGGCTTKCAPYMNAFGKYENLTSKGSEEKWQPLHYMLNHKYGPKELKARVIAGTIKVRANPRDTRFPEFQEVTDYHRSEDTKSKSKTVTITEKTTWDDFKCLSDLEVKGQQLQWFPKKSEEAEDPANDPGKFAFGKKTGGSSNSKVGFDAFLDEIPSSSHGAGSQSVAQSVSSQVLKQLEMGISLKSNKDPEKVQLALLKVRSACNQIKDSLEEQCVGDKDFSKKANAKIKELSAAIGTLDKAKIKGVKKEVVEVAVNQAAKIAKSASKLLDLED